MTKQIQGAWKPYRVANILNNIELVFKTGDSQKLSKESYEFLYLMSDFIAHYDINGFRHHYSDVRDLIEKLDSDYYISDADRLETDGDFQKWYGSAYNRSKAQITRGLVVLARKYKNVAQQQGNESDMHKIEVLEAIVNRAKKNPGEARELLNSIF